MPAALRQQHRLLAPRRGRARSRGVGGRPECRGRQQFRGGRPAPARASPGPCTAGRRAYRRRHSDTKLSQGDDGVRPLVRSLGARHEGQGLCTGRATSNGRRFREGRRGDGRFCNLAPGDRIAESAIRPYRNLTDSGVPKRGFGSIVGAGKPYAHSTSARDGARHWPDGTGVGGPARRREGAGQLRYRRRAERPVERGHAALADGGPRSTRPTRRRGTTSASATSSSVSSTDARDAYEKAIALEPNNNFIRNNYDLFREIYDRQNRRRAR